eukprot:TRINITY_DN8945_c0_g1_i7.p1 TRINITY_DN8945_c0_g1~~TRINITY_DN8945_c0_g1_i7.p1  ORF type:complete len:640 (+),score=189.31 TRINITY_DN8945_c0_g1_i7:444-2363(+)
MTEEEQELMRIIEGLRSTNSEPLSTVIMEEKIMLMRELGACLSRDESMEASLLHVDPIIETIQSELESCLNGDFASNVLTDTYYRWAFFSCHAMLNLFSFRERAQTLKYNHLLALIRLILWKITEPRMRTSPPGTEMLKQMNDLVIMVFQAADFSHTLHILITFACQFHQGMYSMDFDNLVARSILKICKMLEFDEDLQVSHILQQMSYYFQLCITHPVESVGEVTNPKVISTLLCQLMKLHPQHVKKYVEDHVPNDPLTLKVNHLQSVTPALNINRTTSLAVRPPKIETKFAPSPVPAHPSVAPSPHPAGPTSSPSSPSTLSSYHLSWNAVSGSVPTFLASRPPNTRLSDYNEFAVNMAIMAGDPQEALEKIVFRLRELLDDPEQANLKLRAALAQLAQLEHEHPNMSRSIENCLDELPPMLRDIIRRSQQQLQRPEAVIAREPLPIQNAHRAVLQPIANPPNEQEGTNTIRSKINEFKSRVEAFKQKQQELSADLQKVATSGPTTRVRAPVQPSTPTPVAKQLSLSTPSRGSLTAPSTPNPAASPAPSPSQAVAAATAAVASISSTSNSNANSQTNNASSPSARRREIDPAVLKPTGYSRLDALLNSRAGKENEPVGRDAQALKNRFAAWKSNQSSS